ncbi:FHA domain-containing protein [Agreia sp. COWG]|uniref:FHA domain-containing protein n=1 Tax=Agreia sp. COWG TaxID=2773266 RepID=UPI001927C50B|nr:FHA domain-containing protein [Agreia sp. COWG]CAD6011430.1 FHA domain-containing protein [Agreia sp. COWG]
MTRLTYQPGTWRGVVASGAVALFPSTLDGALLDRIWRSLDDGDGLGGVLEALTAEFGASIKAIPPFAVAVASGSELRLAVRGALRIDVTEVGADAPVTVSGEQVTTWNERVVSAAESFVVSSEGVDGSEWLGIRSGVVLCRAVSLSLVERSPAVPDAAVTVVAPVPAPEASLPVVASPPAAPVLPEFVASAPLHREPARELAAEPVPVPMPEIESTPALALDVEETVDELPDGSPPIEEPAIAEPPVEQPPVEPAAPVEPAHAEPEDFGPTVTELPDDAYDHLWGATVVKSVEEAAVRLDDEPDDEPASAAVTPAQPEAPSAPRPEVETEAPQVSSKEWTAPPPTGLIDRVPGFAGVGAAAAGYGGQPAPASSPTPASASATPPAENDHDGLTVTVSELEAMRRLAAADDSSADPAGGPGRIVLATGDVVTLDRPVIVGRRPRAQRVQGDVLPHLVTVASPDQDVSRSHLEVRVEGRHVLVVDLDTTNGSVLHRAGTPPLRLSPSEPVLVLNGDIVDIGDGVTLLFEELP